jgi:recombination associated protein RdgC
MNTAELIEQGTFLGEEFLIWLWMRGLTEGGIGFEGDQSACFVDDSVQLLASIGDVKELSLRRGNPASSREAFEALSRGMRPVRAKIRLLSGDMEWKFTLSASELDMSNIKLPPTQSRDSQGRIVDRLFLLEEAITHMENRFEAFLSARSQDPIGLQEVVCAWLRNGLEELVAEKIWQN